MWFLPSSTKSKKGQPASQGRPKWGSRTDIGIFAGYGSVPGGGWNGRYKVWPLDLFIGLDLTATADGRSPEARSLRSPHESMRVDTCQLGIRFPLKPIYEWWNSSPEGRLRHSGLPGPAAEPPTLSREEHLEPPELDPATAEPKHVEVMPPDSGGGLRQRWP